MNWSLAADLCTQLHMYYFPAPGGKHVYQDVLLPWAGQSRPLMDELHPYGQIEAMRLNWRDDPIEGDLWSWYALSRANEMLLLTFQPVSASSNTQQMKDVLGFAEYQLILQQEEYLRFFAALGMRPIDHTQFHPFFHEIVSVEQSDDPDAPIALVETLWPGLMYDHLLFSRAGVRVSGGLHHINQAIAEGSTLHFTYIRRNRNTCDLSRGWGHNSQWRTRFRRDYEDEEGFHYNVDGHYDLTNGTPPFTDDNDEELIGQLDRDQRIELLVNRCLVHTSHPDTENLWPYDDRYTERKSI